MSKQSQLTVALQIENIAFTCGEMLSGHSTFRIGGPADWFVRPNSPQQLCAAVAACKQYDVPYYFLGNGSNILFGDTGYRGVMLDLTAMQSDIHCERVEDDTFITVSAGCGLAKLCLFARDRALTGLEFAYGIPGTVGGAVYMNAGAYGGEMKDVLVRATILEQDGTVHEVPAEALELRYRHSRLEETGGCVLSATFRLVDGNIDAIRERMNTVMQQRRDKQPLDKPSAGSTFKRPEGAFAAALIDQCGLRGYQVGGAAISEKHCGFAVNLGGATCADVEELCRQVAAIVKEKTGYTLEKEIRVVKD